MARRFIVRNDANRETVIRFIQCLNLTKEFSIEVKQYRKNRSDSQNRLMWSWLNILAEETGHTADDLHEMFKVRFLGTEQCSVMGHDFSVSRSTTKLNTADFTAYLDKIEMTAKAMGINLPHPDDYAYAMGIGDARNGQPQAATAG